MKPIPLILVIVTAGLAFWLIRRHNSQLRADAELWAEATDPV